MQSTHSAIIILHWNRLEDTLECLASILQSKDAQFSIYLVDNGSTDGSLQEIQKLYPHIHYVENGENLGFAEGNNRGMQRALQDNPDYIFLLNNDAILREDTLYHLTQAAEKHPDVAIFGPKIYFYDDPTLIWYGGGDWNPKRASFYHLDWKVYEQDATQTTLQPTGYVCGCAFFIRADVVRQEGGMDPRFFLNWEEIDWCLRLKRKGYPSFFVPKAKCWHKISSSFPDGKRGKTWHYYYWRNRLLWMEKNLPKREFFRLVRRIVWPEFWSHIATRSTPPSQGALLGVRDYVLRRFGKGSL